MSELRKIRRMMATLNKPKRPPTSDVILIIGLILLLIGIMTGGLNYLYYTGGEPAQFANTPTGTNHHEKQPPGNPIDKDTAILSAIGAGLGLVLTASALLTKLVLKKAKQYR